MNLNELKDNDFEAIMKNSTTLMDCIKHCELDMHSKERMYILARVLHDQLEEHNTFLVRLREVITILFRKI